MKILLTCLLLALVLSAPALVAGPYGPVGEREVVDVSGYATGAPVTVTVQESSQSRTVLAYTVGSYDRTPYIINGETYYEISVPGEAVQLTEGLPSVPTVRRSIIIPNDAHMKVAVLSARYIDYENVLVAPSKGNLLRTVDPTEVAFTFDDVYSRDGFYPENLASIGEPYILRDYRGTAVELNAVQYNPVTKVLRVYSEVTLEVTAAGRGDANVLVPRVDKRQVDDFNTIYTRHFLNYEQVTERYTPIGEVGDMLIITHGDFADEMQPLVDWKIQKGMKTTMVNVSSIGNTSTAIKNFVQAFYDSTALTFLLLVGDAAQVASPIASGGESDPSYAKLAGSDNYPEIFVGRFSAETAAQVVTQVQRTLMYETSPVGTSMYTNACGIASDEGPGHFGEYDYQHMNLIRNDLLAYNYSSVDQIYDPGATDAQVAAALNAGRGLVNYIGHGSSTSWSTTGFSNSDVNALTNRNFLPLIIAVACVNGDFGGTTCFAEAWLRASNSGEPTGALATYMSSINQSWNPPMYAQDEINDLLCAETRVTVGGLCFNGSIHMIEAQGADGVEIYDTWHIFGDPSVLFRTLPPTAIAITHSDVIMAGWTDLAVSVPGIEGALCALTYNGRIYGSAYTDAGGNASITLPPDLPIGSPMKLTVSAFNKNPYTADLMVITPEGPYIVYDGNEVSEVLGNGNGVVDVGESVLLGLQLKNVGPDDAFDVSATLSCSDPYVTLTDGFESYGTIPGQNGVVLVPGGFAFGLSPATPDNHSVVFDLAVSGSNRDTWTGTFTVKVHAPALVFSLVTIADAGNGNGILDPGESAELVVTVSNVGTGEAFDVSGVLTSGDPYLTVLDGQGYFGRVDSLSGTAGNSGDVFQVSASPSTPMGYTVSVTLAVTAANGYTVALPFSLIVGDREAFFADDFALNQGWSGLGGAAEWTIGPATGGTGADSYGQPDPAVDHTPTSDNGVLGNDLTSGTGGDYAGGLSSTYWVTSPVIDCSDYTGVQLRYWHWLGIEGPSYDQARVAVYDGSAWVQVWANSAGSDPSSWSEAFYDVSAYADGNPDFQVRFGLGPTDGSWNYCGWNLDDIELKGYDQGGEGDPLLVFAQTSFTDSLLAGETSVGSVRVYNQGTANLRVRLVPSVAWLSCSGEQYYVPPSDSLDIPFSYNAAGVAPGSHVGALHYTSNDDAQASGDLAVTLYVHAPGLVFAPESLSDSLASLDVDTLALSISNTGLGLLHLSVSSGQPWLSCLNGSLTVLPGADSILLVRVTCGGQLPGDYTGQLTYTSDDPSHPSGSVPVSLHIYAPVCGVNQSSLAYSLAPGDSGSVELVITNSGPGRLLYSLNCTAEDVKRPVPAAVAAEATLLGYHQSERGDAPEPFFAASGKGSGGPDGYGYQWLDSDAPGGPVYQWVDISTLGTAVSLTDDAMSAAVPLGFAFPYYDSVYSEVYLGSNGILTFGSGSSSRVNTVLPTAAVPNAVIALWWDDLNPANGGQILYYQDAGRFIVSFVDIRNYQYPSGTGSLTCQAILYPSGKIVLQYATMNPGSDSEGLNAATVGIENPTGTDGLTVVYNAGYMHDNLAVSFTAARWVWPEPDGGSVEPYGSATVRVRFDATELDDGLYEGQLGLSSNDPVLPGVVLPVQLTVASWICGDINNDRTAIPNVADLTYLVTFLFRTGPPPAIPAAADCNGQGGDIINVADLTYLVNFLFKTGPAPICH